MSEPSWKVNLRKRAEKHARKRRLAAVPASVPAPAPDPEPQAEVAAAESEASPPEAAAAPIEPAAPLQEAVPSAEPASTAAPDEVVPAEAETAEPPEPVSQAALTIRLQPSPERAQRPRVDIEVPQAPASTLVGAVNALADSVKPAPEALTPRERLKERLLAVMDKKHHPAWSYLIRPGLRADQLFEHFRHEYLTYVRDFPVLIARILAQGPPQEVRSMLAENLFEEQTGKLSFGSPHPELFLEMMDGLGMDRKRLSSADPPLVTEARVYRGLLDRVSQEAPWVVGAAVLTIFVEGSIHERDELAGTRDLPPIDEAIALHPMVAYYGCPPGRMRLLRAHRAVESGHRQDAWAMVLDHAEHDEALADAVVSAVEEARSAWFAYRDGVARAMGLDRVSVLPQPPSP